jgi:hypothetical protein
VNCPLPACDGLFVFRHEHSSTGLAGSDDQESDPGQYALRRLPETSLALGLLKACLATHEVPIRICYFNLRFARRIRFQQQLASLALARRVKEKMPDTLVIFGGVRPPNDVTPEGKGNP